MKIKFVSRLFFASVSVFIGLGLSSRANAELKFKGVLQTPSTLSIEVPGKPSTLELKSGEAQLTISESLAVSGRDVKLETSAGAFEVPVPLAHFDESGYEFSYNAQNTANPKVILQGAAEHRIAGEREEVRNKRCTFKGTCYSCINKPDFKMECGQRKSNACSGNQETRFRVTTTETVYRLFVVGADPQVRGEFTSEPVSNEKVEAIEVLEPCH